MPAHGSSRQRHRSPVELGHNMSPLSSFSLLFFIYALVALLVAPFAASQTVVNGQIFLAALAIADAPQPGSTYHAGSNLPIAIDVSGNGKLSSAARLPGSGLPTSFDSLEIYLVSSQTNLNLTVSSGPGLLTQESGSTVKHLDFSISSCIPPGAYNLTIYEGSRIAGAPYYSITPLTIEIENADLTPCTMDTNTLQTQPQPASPPGQNPWLDAAFTLAAAAPTTSAVVTTISIAPPVVTSSPAGASMLTVTVGPSGIEWPFTATVPTSTVNVAGQTITRTINEAGPPTTVTVVLASLRTETLTLTGAETTAVVTTTVTSLSTTTAVMDPIAGGDTAGFFPVASAPRTSLLPSLWTMLSVSTIAALLLHH